MGLQQTNLSRAEFFGSLGALALVLATGGCEQIAQEIANRPTRRSIAGLASNDPILNTYRSAISAMKAKSSSDPLNWLNQANIHANHCPHGNWWFFPWHSAYLTYFERIIQTVSGDKSWALPYWNWATTNTCPPVFYNNDSMHDATEGSTPPTESTEFVGHGVLESILAETNFELFAGGSATAQRDFSAYGGIEGTPHNNVHASFTGDMAYVPLSAQDPIFWCHHAMVDYCWVDWQFARKNSNSSDPAWYNQTFTEFYDQNGSAVKVETAVCPLFAIFDYQYEPSQIGNQVDKMARVRTKSDAARLKAVAQKGAPSTISVTRRFPVAGALPVAAGAPATGRIAIPKDALGALLAANASQRAILRIGQVEPPARSDVFVRVFVNAPGTVSASTPITDPHYAGSFAFFLSGSGKTEDAVMPGMKTVGFQVDITDTLRRIGAREAVDVQIVAVPYPGRPGPAPGFRVGALELDLATLASSKPA